MSIAPQPSLPLPSEGDREPHFLLTQHIRPPVNASVKVRYYSFILSCGQAGICPYSSALSHEYSEVTGKIAHVGEGERHLE